MATAFYRYLKTFDVSTSVGEVEPPFRRWHLSQVDVAFATATLTLLGFTSTRDSPCKRRSKRKDGSRAEFTVKLPLYTRECNKAPLWARGDDTGRSRLRLRRPLTSNCPLRTKKLAQHSPSLWLLQTRERQLRPD